jgi:predicted lipase
MRISFFHSFSVFQWKRDIYSTAPKILSTVKQTLSAQKASAVTVVGHSLGGALALLDGLFLRLNLPASVAVKVVSYGMPRVGNQDFANFVDKQLNGQVTHINNQEDPVPLVPLIAMGFHHPSGEIHIIDSGSWENCPGVCSLSLLFFCTRDGFSAQLQGHWLTNVVRC